MESYQTIIVGGGPAGSSCAWQLKRHGQDVLILEKQAFPRLKLCAGWIPEKVLKLLEITPDQYPHSMIKLKTKIYIAPIPIPVLGNWAIPWRTDYSIRRIEFDHWLLQRSQAPVKLHTVKKIESTEQGYIIDDQYRCQYLVGAGGTGCPVRRNIFPKQRVKSKQLSTMEKEFEYPQRKDTAYLFFLEHGLKGYSWYVPKGNGFVNIGLGGSTSSFRQSGTNIHQHFQWFLDDMVHRQLLDAPIRQTIKASGHSYYLFTPQETLRKHNCFLIGDSAGLASLDMAEGIRPAIESGLLAAEEILSHRPYTPTVIAKFSFNPSFHWLQRVYDFVD